MSFREKSTWACLISTLVIYAVYFPVAIRAYLASEAGSILVFVMFVGAVIAQVIALTVAHIVFAVRTPYEDKDEREVAIELKALRNSHVVLSTGVVLTILAIVARELTGVSAGWLMAISPFVLGHALLLWFVVAEVVNYGTQVFHYRRGV